MGTEVAKDSEASDIILTVDDDISGATMWVNDVMRKFLLFQMSPRTLLRCTVRRGHHFVTSWLRILKCQLSATELLWINVITDTFAALALAGST